MGELILQMPLLPGESEMEQFSLIVKLIGSPNDKIWPKMRLLPGIFDRANGGGGGGGGGAGGGKARYYKPPIGAQSENMLERRLKGQTKETVRLINDMLTYDPDRRITANEALRHRYFNREMPPAQRPELIQTFPEIRNERQKHDADRSEGDGPGKRKAKDVAASGGGGGYVFDFPDNAFGEGFEGGKKRRRNRERERARERDRRE
jgi:cyclin-dependent kinase 10